MRYALLTEPKGEELCVFTVVEGAKETGQREKRGEKIAYLP
jgi:hypothetical protein